MNISTYVSVAQKSGPVSALRLTVEVVSWICDLGKHVDISGGVPLYRELRKAVAE